MTNNKINLPLVIIGGGGHASVLVDILQQQKKNIVAVFSQGDAHKRKIFHDIRQCHHDEDIVQFDPDEIYLINGIGKLPHSELRNRINENFLSRGYTFSKVISTSACISDGAVYAEDVQIFPNCVIQTGVCIGRNCVINSGAIIEHDCKIGDHNFISPRAVLCGNVQTGANVFIGAGAVIIQNISIGDNVVIAAGAVITSNVESGRICYSPRAIVK
ncbi:acetyltransferase [Mixta tenebrionis]|uniref:Acetyltransferase n=1 Tax=Mixta tenebrionis TaxID=2562439 RepID=A0A506VAZ2_9GAMM|nr:acetyltransferase [Mixta tenebrionis]TPW42708.1 acetyltransferase [Mixta tenebrionis]